MDYAGVWQAFCQVISAPIANCDAEHMQVETIGDSYLVGNSPAQACIFAQTGVLCPAAQDWDNIRRSFTCILHLCPKDSSEMIIAGGRQSQTGTA